MSDAEQVASTINLWAQKGKDMTSDKDAFNHLLLDYFISPDGEPKINQSSDGNINPTG